jgi:23S rRNA (guanosine2251-2'-O)-methyltransferase
VDILYGRNPVLEALRAERPARKLVVAHGIRADVRLQEILDRAAAAGVTVEESARRRLDDIAHTEHHQGVVGYFHTKPPLRLEGVLDAMRAPALLLVLDGTAEATAVDGIVLSKHHATGVTPAASKTSAGALEHVRVALVSNLSQALDTMHERGVWRVGLDATASQRYDGFDYTQPVAVVVGAEGSGMRPGTRRHCDALVSIPMLGRVESLNAGASAAVLLYEVQRQRGFSAVRE